ncbi:hypothetical protein V5799_007030 [Amblyomma americanum]|uniref:Uncharacterized protein n=1 Tax=Amblyomma americanum TaxID=6943 RepID=A0AAQ4DUP6_AMBAM
MATAARLSPISTGGSTSCVAHNTPVTTESITVMLRKCSSPSIKAAGHGMEPCNHLWQDVLDVLKKIDQSENYRYNKDCTRSGSSSGSVKTRWPYMERMKFVQDILEPRLSHGNMQAAHCFDEEQALGDDPQYEMCPAEEAPQERASPAELEPLEAIFAAPGVPHVQTSTHTALHKGHVSVQLNWRQ